MRTLAIGDIHGNYQALLRLIDMIDLQDDDVLIFLGDPRATHVVVFWMLGGLGLAQWSQLIYPLVVLAACTAWLMTRTTDLNAMTVGDETASTLGIPVARFRLSVFVAGALITGVMVAFSGIIGFVGLIVPHLARPLTDRMPSSLILPSALAGACLALVADSAARILPLVTELRLGIALSLIGAPFFLWLLLRLRRGAL